MIHKPIQIQNLSLSFPHKTCFESFTTQINYGARIAIIGRNGSGKSTLLKMLQNTLVDVTYGYVPQVIEEFDNLSGGQRFNRALTDALSAGPSILLLDEPTNHLDCSNRKSLMRMLRYFDGTLIVVSHDAELLRNCTHTLWHIDNEKIHIFSGQYDDYMNEVGTKRASIEQELSRLDRQKKDIHHALMQEQERASKSKAKGVKSIEQRKWPSVVSKAKALRAEETSGRKKVAIDHKKQELTDQLCALRLPEVITPKFSLNGASASDKVVVSVNNGAIFYGERSILQNINLFLYSKDRIAVTGNNGSGKSSLVKALLSDVSITKSGDWYAPKREDVGYLDQHYFTLAPENTVFDSIASLVPAWSHADIRRHLNDFLFRKNAEVSAYVKQLSGGEKVRLSLAIIAAKTPKLLILDEITNNLDMETKAHVIQVLRVYPGAMIIISHDADFLDAIDIVDKFNLENDIKQ